MTRRIQHDLVQGTAPWQQFRLQHHGASEAAAMLGLSLTMKRSELLRMKHTGLPREFSEWVQSHVLDHGHAVEAMARPHIEELIGTELYPVTYSLGKLSASCDGLDMSEVLAMEHKQWSESLAARVVAGEMPEEHMPQCQQVMLVTGAERCIFVVSDGTPERMVHIMVDADPAWHQRLIEGWGQFDRDLATYTPPPIAEPAHVGKAPDTLPALRIEVQGMVTASNLAEFKQTALTAIRSVNRELKTDADFADADKAVKWCADVEARLKAAKEHALSQTASIDELFKALDDIAAESKAVRLDLGKVIDRRKVEVKEQAVAAARRALDAHVAALNAELAPMALRPVAADFAGAIKGLRSIASMQDALDTTLAGAKIAADGQARGIRANVAAFKAATGDDRALQALFADLGALVHKAADDFAAVLDQRITKHRADEAAREAQRQAAEAQRIAAAEQRAREQAEREAAQRAADERAKIAQAEADRVPAEQRAESARLEALAASNRAALDRAFPGTDDTRTIADVDRHIKAANAEPVLQDKPAADAAARAFVGRIERATPEPATLTLGMICERLQFTVRADFLADVLHVSPAKVEGKRPGTYTESQFQTICSQLRSHISAMGELYAGEVA